MGRFYQAAQGPQFIDGLYTPPWELMDKALSYNQQGYDNALATTNLFQDIDINSINDPVVKEQVDGIKKYYESKSNEITKAIQANPMDWKKSRIGIQNLGRELQEDMKRGSIARIQNAHESMQNFVKEHEEYAKKNPGLFNQGYNHYLEEYRKDPLRMGNFNWENLVGPIDEEKIQKRLKEIKANGVQKADGMWIIGNEEVSEERILESAKNQVYSDQESQAFIQQQIKFKNPDYYNEEYANVNEGSGFYEKMYLDPTTGKVISDTEANKRIDDYEKAKIDYYTQINEGKHPKIPEPNFVSKNGAIGSLMDSLVAQNAYSQQTLKPNSNYIAMLNYQLSKIRTNDSRELAQARLEATKDKSKFDKTKYYNELKQKKMAGVVNLINDVTKNLGYLDPETPGDGVKISELEKKKKDLTKIYEDYLNEGIEEVNSSTGSTDGTADLFKD